LARRIYDVNYPPRENFEPFFETASTKGLPESDESISFAGDFYYQANAIMFSGQRDIPLIDDGSWLPLPFKAQYKGKARSLATLWQ
jgi:hypothetical protein